MILDSNEIHDISPFAEVNLSKLENLSLRRNRITQLTPLYDLTHDITIDVYGNCVIDASAAPENIKVEEAGYQDRVEKCGGDVTPEGLGMAFSKKENQPLRRAVTSDEYVVTTINLPVEISVINGKYSVNGGSFTGIAGRVVQGDVIRLMHTTSLDPGGSVTTIVTIGKSSGAFTSITGTNFIRIPDEGLNTCIEEKLGEPATEANVVNLKKTSILFRERDKKLRGSG